MDIFQGLEVAAEKCFLRLLGAYELQPQPTDNPHLAQLGKKLGIKFITADSLYCKDISYEAPTKAQVRNSIEPLVFELCLYPLIVIKKTRIEQIVLCSNLEVYGKPAAGTLKVGLHFVDTVFIDVQGFRKNAKHGRRTIHHELFHAIDFRDTWLGYVDTEWRKLHGKPYVYKLYAARQLHEYMGRDPKSFKIRDFCDPYDWLTTKDSETPGFVSEYAKYSIPEDKAELFSLLMTEYNQVMRRVKQDPLLERKVAQMKLLLLAFSDIFNEDFWQYIAQAKRP